MTKAHKITLAVAGILLLGALYAVHAYQIAQTRAEAQQEKTDAILKAKDDALAQRDKDFQDFKAQMLQQIADIKTQKQAITVLQPIISPSGQPAPTQVTKGDLPPDVAKTLPGPSNASFTLLSDEQMVKLGQRELSCQITEAGLTKCDADKADYLAQITALKKTNADWAKAGKVGPWIAGLGAARNAAGNGYTPTVLFGRRLNSNLGVMTGVQGRGDLSLWLTWNFGSPK